MTISDDEAWLEQLSGKSDEGLSNEDGGPVKMLRSVVMQQYQSDMDDMGKPDREQLSRLLKRCHDEGLLEQKKRWWQFYWVPELAGVAVVCLLVIVGVNVIGQKNVTGPETIYRGSPDSQLELEKLVASPATSAANVQRDFVAAGALVIIYQTGDDWHVKIDLDIPYSNAINKLLNQYEIPAIDDKQLRLVLKQEKVRP